MNQRQAGMDRARREIVQAAGGQFAVHGYEGTTFSRVAEAMGKPKSAIGYHLFPSKERLAAAVLHDQEDRWERIERSLYQPEGLEKLVSFLLTAAQTVRICPIAAGAVRLMQDMPRIGLEVVQRFDWFSFARRQLEAELVAQDRDAAQDLDEAVDVLLSATLGVLSFRSARTPERDADERLRALWVPLLAHLGLEGVPAIVAAAEGIDLAVVDVDVAHGPSGSGDAADEVGDGDRELAQA